MTDQQPPQDDTAEMSLLGCLITDSKYIGDVAHVITTNCFYHHAHRAIYNAILSRYHKSGECDPVLLQVELEETKLLEKIGGMDYLLKLMDYGYSLTNTRHYAAIVLDRAKRRENITLLNKSIGDFYDIAVPLNETIEHVGLNLLATNESSITSSQVDIRESVSNTRQVLKQRQKGEITGVPTGFRELDELLAGMQPTDVIVLAARTSVGKSALALNIAMQVSATPNPTPTAFFSLEMSRQQLTERYLAAKLKLSHWNMRRGYISDHDLEKIDELYESFEIGNTQLFIDDTIRLTPFELRAKARSLYHKHKIGFVIVDYLQQVSVPGVRNRYEEVGQVTHELKVLAKELDIPVLAVAQLSRKAEDRTKPRMIDLRESGNIEQDADVIILLHREDYYHQGDTQYVKTHEADVYVAKQRNGPTGEFKLKWDGLTMRFSNADEEIASSLY